MSEWERWQSRPDKYPASILSPIPEQDEPSRPSASYQPDRFSTLPDLIVEKEKRYNYHDEPEEFYDRLEIKMRKVYRILFYGENISDDFDSDSINDINDYSDVQMRSHESNEFVEEEYDDNTRNNTDLNRGDKTANVSLYEDDSDTTNPELIYDDDAETMKIVASVDSDYTGLAESEGEHYSESEDSIRTQTVDVIKDKTYSLAENLSEKGETSSNSSQQENKSSESYAEAVVETVEAVVHAEKEMEVIRNDRTPLRDISLERNRVSSPKERTLHVNTGFDLIRFVSFSSTNHDSTPMDLDSVPFSPIFRASTPEYQPSPILKRKTENLSIVVGGKRQRSGEEIQTMVAATESSEIGSKKDIGTQCIPELKNVSSQTEGANYKEVGTQTNPNAEDSGGVEVQRNNNENIGTQTDCPDYSDRSTQTSGRFLEREYFYCNLKNEIYFFF